MATWIDSAAGCAGQGPGVLGQGMITDMPDSWQAPVPDDEKDMMPEMPDSGQGPEDEKGTMPEIPDTWQGPVPEDAKGLIIIMPDSWRETEIKDEKAMVPEMPDSWDASEIKDETNMMPDLPDLWQGAENKDEKDIVPEMPDSCEGPEIKDETNLMPEMSDSWQGAEIKDEMLDSGPGPVPEDAINMAIPHQGLHEQISGHKPGPEQGLPMPCRGLEGPSQRLQTGAKQQGIPGGQEEHISGPIPRQIPDQISGRISGQISGQISEQNNLLPEAMDTNQPPVAQKLGEKRRIIWSGVLQWTSIQVGRHLKTRSIACNVHIGANEPNVDVTGWSNKLKMQLLPFLYLASPDVQSLAFISQKLIFKLRNIPQHRYVKMFNVFYGIMTNQFVGVLRCKTGVILLFYNKKEFTGFLCNCQSMQSIIRKQEEVTTSKPQILLSMLRYPLVWQGLLVLTKNYTVVQMHFIAGNKDLNRVALPNQGPITISLRMSLEPAHLQHVAKRLQIDGGYSIMVAVPYGIDIIKQTSHFQDFFIKYLEENQCAGIVNVPAPGTNETAYVVYILPPCKSSEIDVNRLLPHFLQKAVTYLLIIVTTTTTDTTTTTTTSTTADTTTTTTTTTAADTTTTTTTTTTADTTTTTTTTTTAAAAPTCASHPEN